MDINNLKTKTKDFARKHKNTFITVGTFTASALCYHILATHEVKMNEVVRANLYIADDDRQKLVLTKRNGKTKDFGWSKTTEL